MYKPPRLPDWQISFRKQGLRGIQVEEVVVTSGYNGLGEFFTEIYDKDRVISVEVHGKVECPWHYRSEAARFYIDKMIGKGWEAVSSAIV